MHNKRDRCLRPTIMQFQISRDHAGKRYLKILKKINFLTTNFCTYSKVKFTT